MTTASTAVGLGPPSQLGIPRLSPSGRHMIGKRLYWNGISQPSNFREHHCTRLGRPSACAFQELGLRTACQSRANLPETAGQSKMFPPTLPAPPPPRLHWAQTTSQPLHSPRLASSSRVLSQPSLLVKSWHTPLLTSASWSTDYPRSPTMSLLFHPPPQPSRRDHPASSQYELLADTRTGSFLRSLFDNLASPQ